jgi:glycerol-3-phosphate cytidylyltransferase-like family protein
MTKPLTNWDIEYIRQARHTVESLRILVQSAADHPEDEKYTFYLEAARGYVLDAIKWLENAETERHHYEMDLIQAAVSVAHYTTNLFLTRCGFDPA